MSRAHPFSLRLAALTALLVGLATGSPVSGTDRPRVPAPRSGFGVDPGIAKETLRPRSVEAQPSPTLAGPERPYRRTPPERLSERASQAEFLRILRSSMARAEPLLLGVYGGSDSVCSKIRVHSIRSPLGLALPPRLAPERGSVAGDVRRPGELTVTHFYIVGPDSCRVNALVMDATGGPSHRVTVRRGVAELHLSDGSMLTTKPLDLTFELDSRRGSLRFCGGCWISRLEGARIYHRTWRLVGVIPAADPVATGVHPDSGRAEPPRRLAIRVRAGDVRTERELELTLASHAPATVEWFDVHGRRRASQAIAEPAPGVRRLAWPASGLAAGVYWARVRQGRADATTRVVVLR